MINPNLKLLELAAERLCPLLEEVVFVGGCVTGLLITDPGAADIRQTNDVDVISEIATYADLIAFSQRLRALGFIEDDREGAPACRWRYQELTLDVMPIDPAVIGFSNRWYTEALHAAVQFQLASGLQLRTITAPYFLGTKMEAFRGRGKQDYFASHDLEDFIAVVDGRTALLAELEVTGTALRSYLGEAVRGLLAASRFHDALPGHLLGDDVSQTRIISLSAKLAAISELT